MVHPPPLRFVRERAFVPTCLLLLLLLLQTLSFICPMDAFAPQVGTLALELNALSVYTGNGKYAAIAERITRALHKLSPKDGLYPMYINPVRVALQVAALSAFFAAALGCQRNGVAIVVQTSGEFVDSTVTLGARGDSLYEYLLKQWMLWGTEREQRSVGSCRCKSIRFCTHVVFLITFCVV